MSTAQARARAICLTLVAAACCACATGAGTPGAAAPEARSRPAPPPAVARPVAGPGRDAALVATPAAAAVETAPAGSAAEGRVSVELLQVRNTRGQLLVALFCGERGFPDRGADAFGRLAGKARAGTVIVTFEHVPPGPFAVSAHHDEDGDFAMDTGLFGIPAEGYGFSRDARAPFGPPDFSAARLTLAAGQHQRVPIHMNY